MLNYGTLIDNETGRKLYALYWEGTHTEKCNLTEITVDIYPFMIAIEIENKSKDKDPKTVVLY